MKAYHKPDFLCVGLEKAGTSWLYFQLCRIDAFAMPPVKEIRYFNEGVIVPKDTIIRRLTSKHWHYRRYQAHLRQFIISNLRHPRRFLQPDWRRKFLFSKHNDAWYSGLFSKHKISGDITPTYYHLPPSLLPQIRRRFPKLRVIILLRDPVDRTWSKIKMNLARHRGRRLDEIGKGEIMEAARQIVENTLPYTEGIMLWRENFEHVFVGYYDEILESPDRLLNQIIEFLEGNRVEAFKPDFLEKKVNTGLGGSIPPYLYDFLVRRYLPDVEKLTALSKKPYPALWLKKYTANSLSEKMH